MMLPSEFGVAFGLLLKHREVHGNPPDRPLRDGELEAARVLGDCTPAELQDIDDFLGAQGLAMVIRDGLDFGIPARPGRNNFIYILTRKRGEELAPYLDKRWAFEQLRDGRRRNATKAERVVWVTRMWLTLQWFFYERIHRSPSEVSAYREALTSEKLFIDVLSSGLEQLGNAGQPEGAEGVAWQILWETRDHVATYATRFLKAMNEAGMIEEAGNPGEYRQTLIAAIDMAEVAQHELIYLLPTDSQSTLERRTIELMLGRTMEDQDANPAAN